MATNNAINESTAASGKVLQGQGVGVTSSFSTATYPATATGTGTILRADGTNWVPSTATYPNTAGTTGNVLTSDGTNWVSSSAPGGGLNIVTGTLTNAQIKALHATPVQAIAAQGSGKVVVVLSACAKLNYGGTNAFTAGAAQTIQVYYGTAQNALTQAGGTTGILQNGSITATSNQFNYILGATGAGGQLSATYTTFNNVAINLYNSIATEITGNAANNNTIDWQIQYFVFTI